MPTLWLFCYLLCVTCMGVFVLYHFHWSLTLSTIVIRPSRMAIVLGCFSILLIAYMDPYASWLSRNRFDIESNAGIIGFIYNVLNPSYAALRCLSLIYYWIGNKGFCSWSDFMSSVPGWNIEVEGLWYRLEFSDRFLFNYKCYLGIFVFFTFLSWYFSYRSMCHESFCFLFSPSFWNPKFSVKIELGLIEVITWRGIDTRDKDQKESADNQRYDHTWILIG